MLDSPLSAAPHSWQEQLDYEKNAGRFQGRKEWTVAVANLGLSLRESGKLMGCGPGWLSRLARTYGVNFANGKRPPRYKYEELAPLVEKPLKIIDIAKVLGRHPSSVGRAVKRMFPEYESPRDRRQDALRSRPICSPDSVDDAANDTRPAVPISAAQIAKLNKRPFTPKTIGPAPTVLDLMKVVAAQEMTARRMTEHEKARR